MNQERLSRLRELMTANKIKFNKNFGTVLEHGFSDEARESFFEEVISDIEDIVRHGVNSEFNKSMRDTVASLVEIAVRAGDEGRRTSALERLRAEKRVCLVNLKKTKEFVPDFDLRGNLHEYIDSAREGMDVLKDSSSMHTSVENDNMNKCRKLLDQIDDTVDIVTDVSSSKAVDIYNRVITKLHNWRVKIARSGGLYDASSVHTLKDALEDMHEWTKIYTSSILQRGKMKDAYGVPEDDLSNAIKSVSVVQNVEMFLNHCDVYAKETMGMQNDEVSRKIIDTHAQIREIEKDEQDIVARFKAKQLSRDEAEFALQRMRDKKEYLKFDLKRMESDVLSFERVNMRREMIQKIEGPIRTTYNYVKNNRMHVYTLFSGMDFSRLIGMINNNMSAQEFATGIQEMQAVLVGRGIIDDQGKIQMENIRQQLALADQIHSENRLSILDTLDDKESNGSLLDAFLAEEEKNESETETSAVKNEKMSDLM